MKPLHPMPQQTARLQIGRVFTSTEIARLRDGIPSTTTADPPRWTTVTDRDWIHIHRRASGFCIYSIRVEPDGSGYRFAEVVANRDPLQYKETDDDKDARWLLWMIDRLVLGKDVLSPAHEDQRDAGRSP